MMFDTKQLVQFKSALHQAKESRRDAWEASSKLVGGSAIGTTLPRLVKAIDESDQPDALKDALRKSLSGSSMTSLRQIQGEPLKQLTGLPTTKAVRALCVLFLTESTRSSTPCSRWSPLEVENFLRAHCNPYDLLLDIDVASLLDIGAGDLSFAAELADQYVPLLRARHRQLVLHGIDRLRPGSQLGGRLHADPDILKRLNGTDVLTAEFWGNQDMFALDRRKDVWPCYTIVTCHGPATPTFAYEPTRISAPLIHADLMKTKGAFRRVRMEGEDALEVQHEGRSLLFPPWKFDVIGPLALLNLVAQLGRCCLLTSMDTQVFWEILSQLFEDPSVRPSDVIFTSSTLPEVFGPRYFELNALPIGASMALSDLGPLRSSLARLPSEQDKKEPYRFRYVAVRRGAVFEGIPAGQTARLFKDMAEEAPPWSLTLVPELARP